MQPLPQPDMLVMGILRGMRYIEKQRNRIAPSMRLPAAAARYITLQRLQTQGIGKSIHYTPLGAIAYKIYERSPLAHRVFRYYANTIEPRFRARKILADYRSIMAEEFATIAPHLPASADRIMGIGAGVAGLEVLICQAYFERLKRMPEVVIIDKTGMDKDMHFGFHDVAAIYNSLATATEVLESNGVPRSSVTALEPDGVAQWLAHNTGTIDVVTSLIAWGFHFPVPVYLDAVRRALKPDGMLIIDVRKQTEGRQQLLTAFSDVSSIHDDPKFERLLCRGIRI
jgi:hypothetical protein